MCAMTIYKPSELRAFLESLHITPKKGLSQNFLIDGNIIRKIISTASIQPQDVVLEIGPGPGSLSEALLETGATLIAVEKDRALAEALERFKTANNKFEIYCDDILKFPIEEKIRPLLVDSQKAKVIANLPYHLTTPILVNLVSMHSLFSSLILMVQEEVAQRFTAQPGTKEYGSITVFLNFFCTPHYAFRVSNNCFYPKPKVDSAVVFLELKTPPKIDQDLFFAMTRTAFGHRRKMLRTSLKALFPDDAVATALEKIGINPLARPEELSLDKFLQLFTALTPYASG